MTRRARQPGGFTFIEVMLAAALAAAVAAALYASMDTAFRSRRTTAAKLNTDRTVRLALDTVGRDLVVAQPPLGALAVKASFLGQDQAGLNGHDADTLTFACVTPASRTAPATGDMEEVVFALVQESDLKATQAALFTPSSEAVPNSSVLVRQVLSSPDLLAPIQMDPKTQVICRNVVSFNLRYFDGSQWADTWDAVQQANSLPVAIEVTLEVATPVDARTGQPGSVKLQRIFTPCAKPATSMTDDTSTQGSTTP